jgi:hypothetical protein
LGLQPQLQKIEEKASVVDDRSGMAYQEYHGVYGEDVEAALRFLFNAMAPKTVEDLPLQGRPRLLTRASTLSKICAWATPAHAIYSLTEIA